MSEEDCFVEKTLLDKVVVPRSQSEERPNASE